MVEAREADESVGHLATDHAYVLEVRDMVSLHRVIARKGWFNRRSGRTLLLIILILMALSAAINLANRNFTQGATIVGYMIALIVLSRFAPIGIAWLNAWVWRFNGSPGSLLVPVSIEISRAAVRSKSGLANAEFAWQLVKDIVRAKDHLFIFVAAKTALIVPRRAFKDSSRFDAFCDAASAMHQHGAVASTT
jgi:hypothetical protein